MIVTKYIEIDMAHRVPNHKSKCRNLHGHRYRVTVGVLGAVKRSKGKPDEGMVIDFGDLKAILMDKIDTVFDHNAMFYKNDPALRGLLATQKFQSKRIQLVPFIPTAEKIAEHFFQILELPLKNKGILLEWVKINETPSSSAIYESIFLRLN